MKEQQEADKAGGKEGGTLLERVDCKGCDVAWHTNCNEFEYGKGIHPGFKEDKNDMNHETEGNQGSGNKRKAEKLFVSKTKKVGFLDKVDWEEEKSRKRYLMKKEVKGIDGYNMVNIEESDTRKESPVMKMPEEINESAAMEAFAMQEAAAMEKSQAMKYNPDVHEEKEKDDTSGASMPGDAAAGEDEVHKLAVKFGHPTSMLHMYELTSSWTLGNISKMKILET